MDRMAGRLRGGLRRHRPAGRPPRQSGASPEGPPHHGRVAALPSRGRGARGSRRGIARSRTPGRQKRREGSSKVGKGIRPGLRPPDRAPGPAWRPRPCHSPLESAQTPARLQPAQDLDLAPFGLRHVDGAVWSLIGTRSMILSVVACSSPARTLRTCPRARCTAPSCRSARADRSLLRAPLHSAYSKAPGRPFGRDLDRPSRVRHTRANVTPGVRAAPQGLRLQRRTPV